MELLSGGFAVLGEPLGKCVAMDLEFFRSAQDVSVAAPEHFGDERFLELSQSLVEKQPAIDHLGA